MSQALIKQYKKSIRLRFQNEEIEALHCNDEELRGRSSSVFAFGVLSLINLAFFYLEYSTFGVETSVPMFGYLFAAIAALANALVSQYVKNPCMQNIRLIANVGISMCFVLLAVYLQKYSAYHTVEMSALIVWLAALNAVRFLHTSIVNVIS